MQVLLFVTVSFLIVILIGIIKSNFSIKSKLIFFLLFFSLIIAAFIYEAKLSEKQERNREIIRLFNQGKSVYCENHEVNSSYFILNFATLSFLGKEEYQDVRGVIYPVEKCSKRKK